MRPIVNKLLCAVPLAAAVALMSGAHPAVADGNQTEHNERCARVYDLNDRLDRTDTTCARIVVADCETH